MHNVCRRGDSKKLDILLENHCNLHVCDDYGRTPLHDAFWAATPSVATVELILSQDARGSTPLSYVAARHHDFWVHYLNIKKNIYWPERDAPENDEDDVPTLTQLEPNRMSLRDPPHALPLDLAELVATGKLSPEEVLSLKHQSESGGNNDEDASDESISSNHSEGSLTFGDV